MPLNRPDNAADILAKSVVIEPRSIKLRTKRLNALGNTIVYDIAEAIIHAILACENATDTQAVKTSMVTSLGGVIAPELGQVDLFAVPAAAPAIPMGKLPPAGYSTVTGQQFAPSARCGKLNPTKSTYKHLFSTILKKDGNNNFSCLSRLTRPGKLGGLVGEMMTLGARVGGLHPEYCEEFMGYEAGYTELKSE